MASLVESIEELYDLLSVAEANIGGKRRLGDANWSSGCPRQGVYFFFERGEARTSGRSRVVRVGTHGVSAGSKTTLGGRLGQHRGADAGRWPGGGNHRGSVFRKHLGFAMLGASAEEFGDAAPTWGHGGSASAAFRDREWRLEREVSLTIREMPVIWVAVPGEASREADRKVIERGAIALLAKATRLGDPPSAEWLGNSSPYPAVRRSGLWNVHHVGEEPDSSFLRVLRRHVLAEGPP